MPDELTSAPSASLLSFTYTVQDSQYQIRSGQIQARSQDEAVSVLQRKEYVVLALKEFQPAVETLRAAILSGRQVSDQTLIFFAQEFSILLRGGQPLLKALDLLGRNSVDPDFKAAMQAVSRDVSGGAALQMAMSKHPAVFPKFFVALIQAGEESGALATILKQIAYYLSSREGVRKKVVGVLIYPAIISVVALFAILFFSIQVVPNFTATFKSLGIKLPLATRIIVAFSDLLIHNVLAAVLFPILALFAARIILATSFGLRFLSRLKLSAPLIHPLFLHSLLLRFYATSSVLLGNGVTILKTMAILRDVFEEEPAFADAAAKMAVSLAEGVSLSASMRETGVFPAMDMDSIIAGEEAGNLRESLELLAQYHEERFQTFADRLGTIIEPIIVLVVGAFVGFLLMALLLPIMKLSTLGAEL